MTLSARAKRRYGDDGEAVDGSAGTTSRAE
jgi:hypothetical protein